jgi:hypothetical protein
MSRLNHGHPRFLTEQDGALPGELRCPIENCPSRHLSLCPDLGKKDKCSMQAPINRPVLDKARSAHDSRRAARLLADQPKGKS